MDCRALPFSRLPHQPKLFLKYLEKFASVAPFYQHTPTFKEVKTVAKSLQFPIERAVEVAKILQKQNESFGASAETLNNLERLRNGAVAVVSGQQVGLFSGPAYAIYKALTAVQVARELTRAGIDAVPIFWMATEDHDLDEVRHVTWLRNGKLVRFELPDQQNNKKPVGHVQLGPSVREAAALAAEILSEQGSDLMARWLQESYQPEETYGGSFAKLFARLFADRGLILLDPLDPELHRVAGPVYRKAVEGRDALNERLLARGKELDRAGLESQVKVTARSTLLFYMGEGSREVVTSHSGMFTAGEKSWSREEFTLMAENEPQNFSPNALLRPVVQDFMLPTVAYIGGPAEICYFAQSETVYKQILGRMPVILPRSGFTLVNAKAKKLLRRYRLKVEDLWSGSQEVRQRMEERSVPDDLAETFEGGQKQTEEMLARLKKKVAKLDPTLGGAFETAYKKINFQLQKLRRKTGKAQDSKEHLLEGHQELLESLLYPRKALQSRELCLLPFLAGWHGDGMSELQALSSTKKLNEHYVVELP